MVEPACAAALAAIYSDVLKNLQKDGVIGKSIKNIVVIVCGGFCVNTTAIQEWREKVGLD